MVIASLFQKYGEEKKFYSKVLDGIVWINFDDKEVTLLLEKRYIYLESISKLYNELTFVHKLKMKEYENY